MWKIFQDWESISSVPLGDSTGHLLEFSDVPMLLVRVEGESSGGLGQEFTVLSEDTLTQPLESGQESSK